MNDAHCIHCHVSVAKHEHRRRSGIDVMRLQRIASLSTRFHQVAQIAPGSMRLAEQVAYKLGGGRHVLISRRAEYRQRPLAVFKPGRKNQSWEVAAVVHMKVTEQKDIHPGHLCAALAKAQGATAS